MGRNSNFEAEKFPQAFTSEADLPLDGKTVDTVEAHGILVDLPSERVQLSLRSLESGGLVDTTIEITPQTARNLARSLLQGAVLLEASQFQKESDHP
jgi:hypothetical protein